MNFKEIQELIKLIDDSELAEFKMKDGDLELSIRTKHYGSSKQVVQTVAAPPVAAPVASVPQGGATSPASTAPKSATKAETQDADVEDESKYVAVKSPIVGTFYRSPSPDKPPYLKVGDRIEKGDVVCIVEAMKLFNEIESEISGTVVKVVTEDAQPVEYDQVLFLVDPS